jgi:hypothetical protein
MQTFDTEPTDIQVGALVAPEQCCHSLRVMDTSGELHIAPRGYPLIAAACWLLLVLGVAAGMMIYANQSEHLFVMLVWGGMACIAMLCILAAMNHRMTARGEFAVADKKNRTLTLPRLNVVLRVDQIRFLVELHTWHAWDKGREASWMAELSVVATNEHGDLIRYPILACDYSRTTSRAAQRLVQSLGIQHRYLRK